MMLSPETLSRLKNHLPWRARRRAERLQFASMRFAHGLTSLQVGAGSATASLVAVGDVALAGNVGDVLQGCDGAAILEDMQPIFGDCDLRIGNLETVLTDAEKKWNSIGAFMKASPAALGFLSAAGFKMLALANNHARDCRLAGLLQCCLLLEERGIQHCGAGSSLEQSRLPSIVEVAGLKVGMLGYCDNFRVDADDDAENVAPAPTYDDWIISDIATLRPRVHLVILQLHWGWEFSLYPLLSYRDRARRFAESGSDLVLCHHAHVPMRLEVWKTRIVAHGIGNFIFPRDSYLVDGHPWTYRSYALKVFFNQSGVVRAEIIPCVIDQTGFPKLATGKVAREILGGVGRVSIRLANDALLAWAEDDRTLRDTMSFFASFQECGTITAGCGLSRYVRLFSRTISAACNLNADAMDSTSQRSCSRWPRVIRISNCRHACPSGLWQANLSRRWQGYSHQIRFRQTCQGILRKGAGP